MRSSSYIFLGLIAFNFSLNYASARDEVVRGGWGRFLSPTTSDFSNQILSAEIIPDSLRKENRPLSTAMVKVNGCSQNASFQWQYVESSTCDSEVKMNDELAEFINLHFNQCVQKAANSARITIYPGSKGVVKHIGVVGDKRHSKTRSLHNYGRAIDISSISISGHIFSFENAVKNKSSKDADFFSNLRNCWGQAVRKFSPACANVRPLTRRGGMFASIGEENKSHQKHLHLSLPYCGAEQARRNTYMAHLIRKWPLLALIWIDRAVSDEVTKDNVQVHVKVERISLPNGGEVKINIEEVGEPIGKPTRVKISLKCNSSDKEINIEEDLGVCSFEQAYLSKDKNSLTLEYKASEMKDGELACKRKDKKIYKLPCS